MKIVNTALNIFFLAGASLLLLLILLAGSSDHFPLNHFYWLRADTSNIPGAPATSEWTFWGICQEGDYSNCTLGPAYPISPKDNFHTTKGVPSKLVSNRDTYYFLTRFSFTFTIIAFCFTAITLIVDLLGFCFSIIDKITIFFLSFAVFFIFGVAAFQTAAVVMAKSAFKDDNLSAKVGIDLMAILWAAVVCLLIVYFNTCFANISNSYKKHMERVRAARGESYPEAGQDTEADASSFTRSAPAQTETKESSNNGGIRFFKIKRNNQKVSDEESL